MPVHKWPLLQRPRSKQGICQGLASAEGPHAEHVYSAEHMFPSLLHSHAHSSFRTPPAPSTAAGHFIRRPVNSHARQRCVGWTSFAMRPPKGRAASTRQSPNDAWDAASRSIIPHIASGRFALTFTRSPHAQLPGVNGMKTRTTVSTTHAFPATNMWCVFQNSRSL